MKLVIASILLAACGNSSSGNEIIGQVKKVKSVTPLICSDYTEVDVSLGVIRNGVGSMSHEDVELAVDNSEKDAINKLKWAAENGAIVKLAYNVKRWPAGLCWPTHRLVGMPLLEVVPNAQPEAGK